MNPPTPRELLEKEKWGCTDGFYDYEIVMHSYAATIYHRLHDDTFWRLTVTDTDGMVNTTYSISQVVQKMILTYVDVK